MLLSITHVCVVEALSKLTVGDLASALLLLCTAKRVLAVRFANIVILKD